MLDFLNRTNLLYWILSVVVANILIGLATNATQKIVDKQTSKATSAWRRRLQKKQAEKEDRIRLGATHIGIRARYFYFVYLFTISGIGSGIIAISLFSNARIVDVATTSSYISFAVILFLIVVTFYQLVIATRYAQLLIEIFDYIEHEQSHIEPTNQSKQN